MFKFSSLEQLRKYGKRRDYLAQKTWQHRTVNFAVGSATDHVLKFNITHLQMKQVFRVNSIKCYVLVYQRYLGYSSLTALS